MIKYAEEARKLGISRQTLWARHHRKPGKCTCTHTLLVKFGFKEHEIGHHKNCPTQRTKPTSKGSKR